MSDTIACMGAAHDCGIRQALRAFEDALVAAGLILPLDEAGEAATLLTEAEVALAALAYGMSLGMAAPGWCAEAFAECGGTPYQLAERLERRRSWTAAHPLFGGMR